MNYKFVFVFLTLFQWVVFSQSSQRYFGKNRVQNKIFNWEFLSTQNFDIYFYYGGRESAIYASKYAEMELPKVMELLGYSFYDNILLLVYNTPQDLLQSNLGNIEPNPMVGGVTNFVKPKIEVAFDGNHPAFRANIRKEIARYILRETFYGGNIKEIVQNSYLLSLPPWFIDGLAEYSGMAWSREMDNYVRNQIITGKLKNPNLLNGKDAVLVGQSIWNFIAVKYGMNNVSNIVHLTSITRNHHDAIESALNVDIKEFYNEWRNFYTKMADAVPDEFEVLDKSERLRKRNKKGRVYTDIAFSTTGEYIVYAQNYKGRDKVVLKNLKTKKKKTLTKRGYLAIDQNPDYSKPLVSCGGDVIGVIRHKRKKFFLYTYFSNGKKDKKTLIPGFENILEFDFSDDGNAIVFSAQVNGQSDLHYYNFKDNTYRQLTSDFNDDLFPKFLKGGNAVVFCSNRKQDTLMPTRVYPEKIKVKDYHENYDVFIYDNVRGTTKLERVTASPDLESMPDYLDANTLLYLSDEAGINQLFSYDLATKTSKPITKLPSDIKNFAYFEPTKTLALISLHKGKEHVFIVNDFDPNKIQPSFFETEWYKHHEFKRILETEYLTSTPKKGADSDSVQTDEDDFEDDIDIENYVFESEKRLAKKNQELNAGSIKRKNKYSYQTREVTEDMIKMVGPLPYKRQLALENLTASMNVDNLRGFGFYNEGSLIDIMGNNRFRAGALIFTDLRSSDMFGEYQYLKHRLDFGLRIDKKRYFLIRDAGGLPLWHKNGLNIVEGTVSYPLTNAFRIYASPTYMNILFKQMQPIFLPFREDKDYHLAGVKFGVNYDNTTMYGINMMEGTRYALLYEEYKGVNVQKQDYGRLDLDFRHYKRIHKELLFALRGSAGMFFGQAKKSFMLGGMDNWFNANSEFEGEGNPLARNTSQDVVFSGNTDIFLNQFVTNMRGFRFNSLYGDKYFLLNSEIRWPIVKYIFGKRPLTSSFLRNLQLNTFFDFGSAWTGSSPFDNDNTYNRQIFVQDQTISGVVQTFRSPVLASYGLGLRSYLLGYYMKVDVARGIKDYIRQPWQIHLTIGHDF